LAGVRLGQEGGADPPPGASPPDPQRAEVGPQPVPLLPPPPRPGEPRQQPPARQPRPLPPENPVIPLSQDRLCPRRQLIPRGRAALAGKQHPAPLEPGDGRPYGGLIHTEIR